MEKPRLTRYMQCAAGCATLAITAVFAVADAAGIAESFAVAAAPQPAQKPVHINSSTLFERYRDFLGSDANTRSVIQGLRYGELITLGGGAATPIKFLPPARPMSWTRIDRVLNTAQSGLSSIGIQRPAPSELKAVLTGGTVTAADGRRFAMNSPTPGTPGVSFTSSATAAPADAPNTTQASSPDVSTVPSSHTH